MDARRAQRKLTSILCADVAGFSRLMAADEEGTLARLKAIRAAAETLIARHAGRVFGAAGDNFIAEFESPVEAVRCALEIQRRIGEDATDLAEERRMRLRIGVNLGDVMVEGGDLFGDAVNVASRLQALAEPGGICISAEIYRHVRNKVALAAEDMGEHAVKNIPDPVHVYRIRTGSTAANRAALEPMFDRPAVAVLPLVNMSGDADQEYLADGLTEDIITALAAWRSFPVIARNSSFIYKGRSVDARQVGRELGARYVLEGSVRRSSSRLRITVQLIDTGTGHHLWAERFDRELADVFALQDEITQRVVATVEPELERAESRRSSGKRPDSLGAWDYYLRGLAHLNDVTAEGNARAREMFEQAIALDPSYSLAFTGLANSHHRDILLECSEDRAVSQAKLLEAACKAVALDDASATAHEVLSTAHIWANRHDLAIAEAERAIQLDPNSAAARRGLGNKLDLAGRSAEGIAQMERALQLNPQDPQNHVHMTFLARAHLTARHYEDAAIWARRAIQRRPNYPHAHYILAIALGHLGRRAEARAAIEECERLHPGFVARRAGWRPYPNPADNEHLHEGLRKALLPE